MNVLFVGGVHGVGKSTMCSPVAQELGAAYMSASDLIKAEKASAVAREGKLVANVLSNQELLIQAFGKRLRQSQASFVILDGHFALRDTTKTIQQLPVDLYSSLGITGFACIFDYPSAIAERISERDSRPTTAHEVSELQEIELQHAKLVAHTLGKPLQLIRAFDGASLKEMAEQMLGTY
ncbi:ATP-binding protein [Cupriavidus basilensis]|uniref:ATP-binding protein n=1 Tax=Cupriavidus basilensis TaxID=68895 RepID=UPI0020A6A9E3|nr:ATP-binding protein [Cupriavidus basilensis]MCP3024536.1 ATP-binding protein [Cupriavidus basilensis]